MSRFALRPCVAFCVALCTTLAAAADFPAPLKTLELADGDAVVFLGDSITHQCLYTQYVEDFFYTRHPGKRIRFHNAGVGGARAWDALQRFDRDVAAYKPKYVTVLLGMNDGSYRPFDQATFDTYTKDMTEVVAEIRKTGATPVLMTPTMYDSRAARMKGKDEAAQEFYNSVLAYYGTWLRDRAERNGFGFVDMWSPLNNLTIARRKTEPEFTMIADAVHPGPAGQLVMAYAILEDMGLRGPVSAIRIDASRDEPKGGGSGGKLSDLKTTEKGVSFVWAAESLPFVVPEEAREGAKLLKLGHRASREAVIVSGLPTGDYELSIDGEPVGTFSSARLAAGVEMQENDKTPQYGQALQVAELNRRRNREAIEPLRNEWGVFQQYARAKRAASEQPDNAQAAGQFKQLEQRIAGMEDRVAKHEAAAKAIEDEIFKINVPRPHTYELRRMAGRAAAKAPAVSGVLTLDGRPANGAVITFVGDAGARASAVTDEAGRFRLDGKADGRAAEGRYRVTIRGGGISDRYSDPEKTDLAVEVHSGANEFHFDLVR